jgi:hypothetical protein
VRLEGSATPAADALAVRVPAVVVGFVGWLCAAAETGREGGRANGWKTGAAEEEREISAVKSRGPLPDAIGVVIGEGTGGIVNNGDGEGALASCVLRALT